MRSDTAEMVNSKIPTENPKKNTAMEQIQNRINGNNTRIRGLASIAHGLFNRFNGDYLKNEPACVDAQEANGMIEEICRALDYQENTIENLEEVLDKLTEII